MDSKSDFNQRTGFFRIVCFFGLAMGFTASAFASYSSSSTDGNVMNSCTDFSLNGSGVLSAVCNEWDAWGVDDTEHHSIDLDKRIGNDNGKLNFASDRSQKNFSQSCDDEAVIVKNDQLILKARCLQSSSSPLSNQFTLIDPDLLMTTSLRIDHLLSNDGWIASENTDLKWR